MVLSTLAIAALLSAIAYEQGPDFSKPRALPSLVQRWKIGLDPCAITVWDGVVFILTKDRLMARNAATGEALWEQESVAGECPYSWQEPLRVMDDLVVATVGHKLFVVERSRGRVVHAVALGGRMSRLAGPPIVIEIIKGAGPSPRTYELLNIDARAGRVVARRALKDPLSDLDVFGKAAVIAVRTPGPSTHDVIALGLPGLTELWRLNGRFYGAELIGQLPYLLHEDWERSQIVDFHLLDLKTGQRGPPLPPRASPNLNNNFGLRLPFELEVVATGGSNVRLRRNSVPDAQAMWTTELPGAFGAWAREKDRLYLHCATGGRGILVAIDWATGALRDGAYGLRSVYQIATSDELVILASEEGVVAVSGETFGPPEAAFNPAADEARRILSTPMEFWSLGEPMSDLTALGPEALPTIASLVGRLDAFPLQVAALVLGEGGYRPAAAALAARLKGVYAEDKDPRVAVLQALSRIGGDKEVPAVAASLEDPSNQASLRRQSLATLASIGTPEAVEVINRFLDLADPSPPWWDPLTWWDAMRRPPRSEEQEIVAAITDQYFRFEGGPKQFKFTIYPARPGTFTPVAPGERVYQILLENSHAPHSNQHQIVVRKIGRRWVIREISDTMRIY